MTSLTLEDIPRGETVFIDANIFVYHFTGVSPSSTAFLKRCEARDLAGITSWPIVFEVLHRLMMIEAVSRGLVTPGNVVRKLREKPPVARQLSAYHRQARAIPAMGIAVLPVGGEVFEASHPCRQQHGLLINDSLSAALMELHGIRNIATSDADFLAVPTLTVFAPPDVRDRSLAEGVHLL